MPTTRRLLLIPFALICAASLAAAADLPASDTSDLPVVGYLSWPGHDLSHAQMLVFQDMECTRLFDVASTEDARGNFVLSLPPGSYWMMATVDSNADGRVGEGDGIGFYGMTDPARQRSLSPFVLDAGAVSAQLSIDITMLRTGAGEGGVLLSTPALAFPPMPAAGHASVSGVCRMPPDSTGPLYVLLQAAFPRAPSAAAVCEPDGSFRVDLAPAGYYLMAVQDTNGSGIIDAGDRVGLTDYSSDLGPNLPLLKLDMDQAVTGAQVALDWTVGADGRLTSPGGAPGPRLQLGSLPAIVTGTVRTADQPAAGAVVTLFAGSDLAQKIAQLQCDDRGRFCTALRAASYYLVATFDADGDGRLGPGDRLGFYGLTSADQSGPPPPLTLIPGQLAAGTDLTLTMELPAAQTPPTTAPPGDDHATPQQPAP